MSRLQEAIDAIIHHHSVNEAVEYLLEASQECPKCGEPGFMYNLRGEPSCTNTMCVYADPMKASGKWRDLVKASIRDKKSIPKLKAALDAMKAAGLMPRHIEKTGIGVPELLSYVRGHKDLKRARKLIEAIVKELSRYSTPHKPSGKHKDGWLTSLVIRDMRMQYGHRFDVEPLVNDPGAKKWAKKFWNYAEIEMHVADDAQLMLRLIDTLIPSRATVVGPVKVAKLTEVTSKVAELVRDIETEIRAQYRKTTAATTTQQRRMAAVIGVQGIANSVLKPGDFTLGKDVPTPRSMGGVKTIKDDATYKIVKVTRVGASSKDSVWVYFIDTVRGTRIKVEVLDFEIWKVWD